MTLARCSPSPTLPNHCPPLLRAHGGHSVARQATHSGLRRATVGATELRAGAMTGRRDFGTVRLLSTGRYLARYVDRSGRRHARSFATKGDATRFLAGARVDLDRGDWVDPKAGQLTFEAYASTWLAERRVKGRPVSPRPGGALRQPTEGQDRPGAEEDPAPLPGAGRRAPLACGPPAHGRGGAVHRRQGLPPRTRGGKGPTGSFSSVRRAGWYAAATSATCGPGPSPLSVLRIYASTTFATRATRSPPPPERAPAS